MNNETKSPKTIESIRGSLGFHDRQSRYFIAQEKQRLLSERIASIHVGYTFFLDDFHSFFVDGICVQAGMRVVSKSDPADRFLVICRNLKNGLEEGEWVAVSPPFRQDDAPAFILAVKARVASNYKERRAA